MYKRRKLEGLRPLFSLFFWVGPPSLLEDILSFVFPNKTSYTTKKKEKIAQRNINSLRYANDTTLRAESEEELSAS